MGDLDLDKYLSPSSEGHIASGMDMANSIGCLCYVVQVYFV